MTDWLQPICKHPLPVTYNKKGWGAHTAPTQWLRKTVRNMSYGQVTGAVRMSDTRRRLDRIATQLTPLPKLPSPVGHRDCQRCSPRVGVHTAPSFRPSGDVNAWSKQPGSRQAFRIGVALGDLRVKQSLHRQTTMAGRQLLASGCRFLLSPGRTDVHTARSALAHGRQAASLIRVVGLDCSMQSRTALRL